jgi:hypothetical protein
MLCVFLSVEYRDRLQSKIMAGIKDESANFKERYELSKLDRIGMIVQ